MPHESPIAVVRDFDDKQVQELTGRLRAFGKIKRRGAEVPESEKEKGEREKGGTDIHGKRATKENK